MCNTYVYTIMYVCVYAHISVITIELSYTYVISSMVEPIYKDQPED